MFTNVFISIDLLGWFHEMSEIQLSNALEMKLKYHYYYRSQLCKLNMSQKHKITIHLKS